VRRGVPWRAHAVLAAGTFAAILFWCLLMFIDRSATIHQGSHATMLGLFALLCAWCDLASAWTLALIAALQTLTFATTWAVANNQLTLSRVDGATLVLDVTPVDGLPRRLFQMVQARDMAFAGC